LRATPEIFAALEQPAREAIAAASRELQATIAANIRALQAARQVVGDVVQLLGQSLESVQRRPSYAPAWRAAEPVAAAPPVAFNREI
jgi:hypothetical protein